jgi:hypothetical protein
MTLTHQHVSTIGGAGASRRLPHTRLFATVAVSAGLAVAAFLLLTPAGRAATVNVSDGDQLASAVSNAGSGDTISLGDGTYAPGAPIVVKTNLTIVGPDVEGPVGKPPGAVISGAGIEGPDANDIIDVQAGATLTLQNVSLRLTSSQGVAIDDSGAVNLQASELSQNNGVAAVLVEDGATLTATNSTLAANLGVGADVFGTATFDNVTIADNKLGGIFNENGSQVSITNTLVIRNGNGTKWSQDCAQPVSSSTSSLDGDGSCGAGMHGDAKIGYLNLNGGPTATLALEAGSPAIGAGATSACPSLDQRLAPRVGGCDLGAYQYGANVPAQASSAPTSPVPPGATSSGTSGGRGEGSSAGSSKPKPSASAGVLPAAKLAARLAASGVIAGLHETRLHFALAGTAGATTGLLNFSDPSGRIRLHVTAFESVRIDAGHGTAIFAGAAVNLVTGRKVTFRVTVARAHGGTFRIAVGRGYARGGTLSSGRVSIKV